MHEEPFGPVASVTPFRTFDEVIERANNTHFGLSRYVFTDSQSIAIQAAEALEVGTVGVNDMMLASADAPFGGTKDSGIGREGGKLGIFEYLSPKYTKLNVQPVQ